MSTLGPEMPYLGFEYIISSIQLNDKQVNWKLDDHCE